MGIALNGDVLRIATHTAANARCPVARFCIHSGKPFNGNVLGRFTPVAANTCTVAAVAGGAAALCSQAAGFIRVKLLAVDFLALIIRCIGNGHGAFALFVQSCQIDYPGIIQYILAVQLNGGVAGAIHLHRGCAVKPSFLLFILILAVIIRLDVHIAQADVQDLFLRPVVDDADDVVGGVAFTALGRGLRFILVGGIALSSGFLGGSFQLLFYRGFLNFLLCILSGGLVLCVRHSVLVLSFFGVGLLYGFFRLLVPGCFLRLFFLGFFFGSRCCFRFFGLSFRFPFGFGFRLLVGGLFLNLFRWLFFLRFLFRGGHFGFTNGGYGRGLGIRRLLYRLCHLRLLVLCAFIFLQGGIVLAGAVLQNDFAACVMIFLIALLNCYIIRAFFGNDINAAVANVVNVCKGRGCNGRDNGHDGCRRKHPQTKRIFLLHGFFLLGGAHRPPAPAHPHAKKGRPCVQQKRP